MSDNDIEDMTIEGFAFHIDNKDRAQIKKILDRGILLKGFPPLAIAGMHTNGTWVLDQFGNKENLLQGSTSSLSELASHLQLDVDDDILHDSGFTPLMLAVMFGPPQSVEVIIRKVGKEGLLQKTKQQYDAKIFANCRNDESIQKHFMSNNRNHCEPCTGCSVM
eukprot:CAMPEP_0167751006 /NCGR_PEP_ID=MMETSP0110_2-20121227/6316_1 /TAXON_ID=629695 /ORGANISM="Gymnochlora sp., Strain CCMP2014" /LENGTH=163 /DNA_ID=CAMNT_0007636409 /DNA_START=78 /DNA_END=569 /DNA_ORIENTATION=+